MTSFSLPRPLRRLAAGLLVPAALSVLAACASSGGADRLAGVVTPYRIDILQGNVITREQVAVLKPGLSREQVQSVLGTPLLVSVFHANRWDYVFTLRRPGQAPQERKVVLWFRDGVLERFDAPELPSEQEFVAGLDPKDTVSAGAVPVLEASEAQLQRFSADQRGRAPTQEPVPLPLTSYPPLESR